MLFSIFTPTHRTQYLSEVFESLLRQNSENWEWIIVPNGERQPIPGDIQADDRVLISPSPTGLEGVGALKRFACSKKSGEYLLELDHDDLLTDGALNTLAHWIEKEDRPGFLFSDFVNFYPDGHSQVYNARFGWENYPFAHRGNEYTAMRAFEAGAASLSRIFFAPNHVRVWRRDVYEQAGSDDAGMEVGDDHDLLCRTYLTGTRMVHIPEVLYLHRLQEGASEPFLEQNAEFQDVQQDVSNRYVYDLIRESCRRKNLPMIDLGGRIGCPEGYRSVDLVDADIECDIRLGLPLEDDSVGCVRAYDFLEHIPACSDSSCTHGKNGEPFCSVGLMNEIYRVLAPGGWLVSRTPSTDGRGAFQDPTHCSFWNPNSFWYYTHREVAQYVPGIECRFQATRIWQTFPTDWHKQHNIPYVFADLIALKGQRQPGICEI